MRPLPNHPLIRAGAGLAAVAMAVLGWYSAERSGSASLAPAAGAPVRSASRPARPAKPGGIPDSVRQRMAAVRAITAPEERLRATLDLADSIPVAEIRGWLVNRWFSTSSGFDVTLFNRVLKERWQQEDPGGFLVWSAAEDPFGQLAGSVPSLNADPQRILDYLTEHPARTLELRVLSEIAANHPALALAALKDLPPGADRTGMADSHLRDLLGTLAKASPAALEAALADLPAAMRAPAECALTANRLVTSFSTEIRNLWDRPDGWKVFQGCMESDGSIKGRLVDELANLPPSWRAALAREPHDLIDEKNLAKWRDADLVGLGFTVADATRIRQTVLSRIGWRQPAEALKLLNTMDLPEAERRTHLAEVFSRLRDQPAQAEALLAMLGSEAERQVARGILAPAAAPTPPPGIDDPAAWLAKVGAADPAAGGGSYQYLSMLRGWDAGKLDDLANRFRNLPEAEKQRVATAVTADHTLWHNGWRFQAEALHYLISQPGDAPAGQPAGRPDTIGMTSKLAAAWVAEDPAAASAWVNGLPAGEAKQWAQKNLAANWLKYDPAAVERWVNSLPAADREPVREFLKQDAKP